MLDVQENLEMLLTYTDGTEHGNMAEEHQRELNTRSSTVTPWWWGFKILVKVRAGGRRGSRGPSRAVLDDAGGTMHNYMNDPPPAALVLQTLASLSLPVCTPTVPHDTQLQGRRVPRPAHRRQDLHGPPRHDAVPQRRQQHVAGQFDEHRGGEGDQVTMRDC